MSARVGALAALMAASACGSVDLGQDVQFSAVSYDQNYFYCKVEPVLFEQSCGPGKSGTDIAGGCHYATTAFRLTKHDPVPCKGLVPTGVVPQEAQLNYVAAEFEMDPDPQRAALLNHPTDQDVHPRQIFEPNSEPANVIRDWATKYSSQ